MSDNPTFTQKPEAEACADEETKTRQVAEEKVLEQRKRRRVQVALIAAILILLAGGAFAWWADLQPSDCKLERERMDTLPSQELAAVEVDREARPNVVPTKPGVSVNEEKALKGYTLVAPMNSTKAFLIDMESRVVKTWETGATPALSTYLLDNGNLLRTCTLGQKGKLQGPGAGGRVQEINWAGEVVWDFTYSTDRSQQHHDIHRMPNGNILMIVWDKKTEAEAIAAGRHPDAVKNYMMADSIIEVKPTGKTTGEIVWEWRVWDHLVQDFDKTKPNYGNVSQKAELIDMNFGSGMLAGLMSNKDDFQKLKDLGYVGGGQPPPKGPDVPNTDWTHINSVSYNADLDQIVLSVHEFNEIWILDHSTTNAEAAGHAGGKSGKGGDLLYRWGNPRAYRSGTTADQKLFAQHSAHWIPKGLPGAGNMLVFNNGMGRRGDEFSSVDELFLPLDPSGKYTRKAGLPFGPDKPTWSYTAEKKNEFFAMLLSGAQRLPNGNTLVCSGPDGTVFEVAANHKVVWKFSYANRGGVGGPGGPVAPPAPGGPARGFGPGVGFGPPGGFGPLGGGMGGGQGGLFRSYRYTADHPGLIDKDLKPGKKIEDIFRKN